MFDAQATTDTTPRLDNEFLTDVLTGLSQRQKHLQPKYFYDEAGSKYFDAICDLQEYYPYHLELALLPQVARDIAEYFMIQGNPALSIVEFGAGSLRKINLLLKAIERIENVTAIDISREHLLDACRALSRAHPQLSITPRAQDFTKPLHLAPTDKKRLGFFPGSTIGNLDTEQAQKFLRNASQTLGPESYLLIGVDTKKDESILNRAYNDHQGITARFNKNILQRINRELSGDFILEQFAHHAFYNPLLGRIEMHLRSTTSQHVTINGEIIAFAQGESIHTENSYKYHPEEFDALAQASGWQTCKRWLADDKLFAISLLKNTP